MLLGSLIWEQRRRTEEQLIFFYPLLQSFPVSRHSWSGSLHCQNATKPGGHEIKGPFGLMPISAPGDEDQMGPAEGPPYRDEKEENISSWMSSDAHCVAFVIRPFETFPLWPIPHMKSPVCFALYTSVSLEMSLTGFAGEVHMIRPLILVLRQGQGVCIFIMSLL